MVVGEASPYVKDGPDGIKDASYDEIGDAGSWYLCSQRLPGENDEPAHQQVEDRGHKDVFFHEKYFENDPQNGNSPHDSEKRPAEGTSQWNKENWCIRTGNKQIDGRMVENLKEIFGAAGRKTMDESRRSVEQEHRYPVNRHTCNVPRISSETCENNQQDKHSHTQDGSNSVSYGICDFFLFRKCMCQHRFNPNIVQLYSL